MLAPELLAPLPLLALLVSLFPEAMLLHHLDNLDSKMECMRALAEKDRHIEGCWTGYSPSLERAILKKAKYLEDAPVRDPSAGAPASGEGAPLEHVGSTSPQPPPTAENQQHFTPSSSPFAEKLQQAWRKDP